MNYEAVFWVCIALAMAEVAFTAVMVTLAAVS
jgi:hypothetical protein